MWDIQNGDSQSVGQRGELRGHIGERGGEKWCQPKLAASLRALGDGTCFLSSRAGLLPRQRSQGKSCCIIFYFFGLTFPSPDPLAEFPEVNCSIGAEHPWSAGEAWGCPSCTVLPWIYPRDAGRKHLPEKISSKLSIIKLSRCIPLPCSIPKIMAGWDSNYVYHGKGAMPGKTGWEKGPRKQRKTLETTKNSWEPRINA